MILSEISHIKSPSFFLLFISIRIEVKGESDGIHI